MEYWAFIILVLCFTIASTDCGEVEVTCECVCPTEE